MTLDEIKKDIVSWQRLLRLAGYYHGKVDGIRGKLTYAAEAEWHKMSAHWSNLYGRYDERTERNLATLLPEVQRVFRKWLSGAVAHAAGRGYKLKVICGTRSYAEQDALYRQRPKVTNARGGRSNHNFGVAIDIGLFDAETGDYITSSMPYDELAAACPPPSSVTWGGSWKSLHDSPHYQSKLFGDSTAAIRERFES